MPSIKVKHNVEMAHRLSQTAGKCEQIHGHSWWVILTVEGRDIGPNGMILEFGDVKRRFRDYLDTNFDHKTILNNSDAVYRTLWGTYAVPGVRGVPFEPTTENFAQHIYEWAMKEFGAGVYTYSVEVWETSVNCAVYP